MKTPSRARLALATAGVTLALASAGTPAAFATAPTGETVTPLARGALVAHANVNRKVAGGRIRIKTEGALDALMVEITLAPGGTGGWHTHSGPVITIVKQGSLTIFGADCKPHQITAGHGAILSGSITKDENQGTSPVTFVVTFLIPHDAAGPRIDAPAPAGCSA